MMQKLQCGLGPGVLVEARGELWYVRRTRGSAHGWLVTLDGADPSNRRRTAVLLSPVDRIEPVRVRSARRRRRDVVVHQIVDAACGARPAGGLWSLAAADMDLLWWQLAPALAVVHGATRVLLADAVGLGKTIQAGLVIAELRARGVAERALVLAPAALREGWAVELRRRFELPVSVLDHAALLDLERTIGTGLNPWAHAPVVVSSIDLVKRPEIRVAVESAPFDVLVVDEAHHATPGTDRHAAVARLAAQAPWVVLATATPHSGAAGAFRALLDIGATATPGPAMQVFRRSHGDMPLPIRRRTRVLRVTPHASEAQLHAGVLAYARALGRTTTAGRGAALLGAVLARRATSSPAAVAATLRRRSSWLRGQAIATGHAAPLLPWEELDTDDDGVETMALQARGFASTEEELALIADLLQRADAAAPHWTKLRRLRRLLDAVREPLIVFTEYTATLDACVAGLGPDASAAALHGGLSLRERQHRLRLFLDGAARVLVTTDVAGEGLNLQGPSRVVVTLEWPWSPLRLEQRIGRVHRLGQRRTVHAIHLTAADSYEETVVAHLVTRAARASGALASVVTDTAKEIESALLGNGGPRFAESTRPGHDEAWRRAAANEVHRVATWRRLRRTPVPVLANTGPVWAAPRCCGAPPLVLIVVEVSRHRASGTPCGSTLVPLTAVPHDRPRHRRDWRRLCRRLAADPAILRRAVSDVESASRRERDNWAPVRARLAAIGLRRQKTQRGRPLQTSLFDRRAIRDSEQRNTVRLLWDRWQDDLAERLDPSPVTAHARVVAVLPLWPTHR